VTKAVFNPKIKTKISNYTEGITNLGETLTNKYLNLEMRFQIVFNIGESLEGADSNYIILICL